MRQQRGAGWHWSPSSRFGASPALRPSTGEFGPFEAKGLTLILSSRSGGVEGITRQTRRTPESIWTADGLPLAPGVWHVRIAVLVNDFELVSLEAELEIGR